MASPDKSQEVLKDLSAGRDISLGDVSVEMNSFTGPQEITVAGVGESPPNFQATWVNRETVQVELQNRLIRDPVTEIVAMGGFGKSWLAAWAYAELAKDFNKRLWVNFRLELWQAYGFDRFARWILQEIGFPQKDPAAKEDLLLRELTYRLNDQNRPVKTLVVMDNLESLRQSTDWPWFEQFLQIWMAHGQGSRILVTTQPNGVTALPLELDGLSLAEGTAFLQREGLTGDRFAELIELADGHPLLLNLAAAWVRQIPGAKVDDSAVAFFSHLFKPYRRDATSLIEAKVELIFEQVFKALSNTCQELLLRVSVYRLPFDLVMAQAMEETITLKDLEDLVAQALLVEGDQHFTLHALIAELVQARVSDRVKQEAHEHAIAYYQAHYRPWNGTIASCFEELEAFHHAVELGQYGWANEILSRCVKFLDRAGYWRDLLPLYQTLTQHWQAADRAETQNLGWGWTWLGCCYGYGKLGDFQAAITTHQQALTLFKSLNFLKGQAHSLNNLGNAYHFLKQDEQAIELYEQSLDISREIKDLECEGASLGNLGSVYESLGQYQQAIELLQQSLEVKREIGDQEGEGSSLGELGNVYDSLGQHERANVLYAQCLDINRRVGNRHGEAAALGNLGITYTSLGRYEQALDFHQQSLDIKREIGDRRGEANTLGNLGNAYYALGQYQRAIGFYQQALDAKREIGDCGGEAKSHWNLADTYRQCGHVNLAMKHRHLAYRIWHDMELPLAATPLPNWTKNMIQTLGDDWAEQLITGEKRIGWLLLPLGYFIFLLRKVFSPLTWLQKRLKIHSLVFWFALGVALVLLVAWLQ